MTTALIVCALALVGVVGWYVFEFRWDRHIFAATPDCVSENVRPERANELLASNAGVQVVDVRSAPEFEGTLAESWPGIASTTDKASAAGVGGAFTGGWRGIASTMEGTGAVTLVCSPLNATAACAGLRRGWGFVACSGTASVL